MPPNSSSGSRDTMSEPPPALVRLRAAVLPLPPPDYPSVAALPAAGAGRGTAPAGGEPPAHPGAGVGAATFASFIVTLLLIPAGAAGAPRRSWGGLIASS